MKIAPNKRRRRKKEELVDHFQLEKKRKNVTTESKVAPIVAQQVATKCGTLVPIFHDESSAAEMATRTGK